MKVFLLKSKELSIEKYNAIFNVLNQFKGPIHFISTENDIDFKNTESRIWPDDEEFGIQQKVCFFPERISSSSEPIKFPYKEDFLTWEDIFMACNKFRLENAESKSNQVLEEDLVFLLTEKGNDLNWFGSLDDHNNFFVQTSGWAHFLGLDVDERFPIAFAITTWILRRLMFDLKVTIFNAMHQESIGCCNDFCAQKKEIILKMRTADLCSECMALLEKRNISPLITDQLFNMMEGIRKGMIFRNRMVVKKSPSKLEVRGYMMRLFLVDLGDLELTFNPKEKAVYLFYLNHPEGVRLSELQDYEDEIMSYYSRFSGSTEKKTIQEKLKRLLNPLDNNINEVLSRIKAKLRDSLGEKMITPYLIDGSERGGRKQISLDREFVKYVDD